MKRILLLSLTAMLASNVSAQGQIGNSDMEMWESVSSDFEPVNWNSFLSAQGSLTSFAANQIEASGDIRPGSAGTKSARIWTRDAGFNIKANGNLTLGRVNMESLTPSSSDNHNLSLTADPLFSEALTDTPDSIVFWVKYNASNSSSEARMKATLHDDYDYTDPETGTSADHVVASAVLDYSPTGWVRMSVAFDYSGPATTNTFILVTFASNGTPGGGDVNDEVYIDDVELIYNSSSIDEPSELSPFAVAMNNNSNVINFSSTENVEAIYSIYNTVGQQVQTGDLKAEIPFNANTGIYFVHIATAQGSYKYEIYKK